MGLWYMTMQHILLSILTATRREQALKAFKAGCISLEERASVDESCDAALQRIISVAAAVRAQLPDDLQLVCRPPVASYHINLSGLRTALLHVLPKCLINGVLEGTSKDSVVKLT